MITHTDILIVGQGISGTMLSWFLHSCNVDFLIIDKGEENASSISGGIINPVTGRRIVKVWMDDILIPFAAKTYTAMGNFLSTAMLKETRIVNFFPNPFMRESFLKKIAQQTAYINMTENDSEFNHFFTYEFGIGNISPAYIVYVSKLLSDWRGYLSQHNWLRKEVFDFDSLKVTEQKIIYKNIICNKIIFCDGVPGQSNPFFSSLPFALNKGEALIIEAKDLPHEFIYKKSITLVPLQKENLFWVGTNYLWDFDDDKPTETFRNSTELTLKNWLKVAFTVQDHRAAVRPATVERRPFVGFHPVYKNVGLLNGMGTKGCSLAPYFAHQLVQSITKGNPISPEVSIKRHERILFKNPPIKD